MPNRFHISRKPAEISPEEINTLLHNNNQGVEHNTLWADTVAPGPTKEEVLMARREQIRETHASDFAEDDSK